MGGFRYLFVYILENPAKFFEISFVTGHVKKND